MLPRARQERLLVEEVGDELIIYDQDRDRAHRLNRSASLVWRHCDGIRTNADLAALLQAQTHLPAEEEVIRLALNRLEKAHLLQKESTAAAPAAGITRRDVIRGLGLSGTAALLLPVVTSLAAPTPAMAASGSTAPAEKKKGKH